MLYETATYCKSGDEFRPLLVGLPDFTTLQVCPEEGEPDPVLNAYPDGWYIRIMFDELLDPSIETLTPILDEETGEDTGSSTGSIAAANPVTLQCQSVVDNSYVDVDYDGYYSPSGNRVTWPVGPSLVIKPNDPTLIATGKKCRVTINAGVVLDKQGQDVPTSDYGPYEFQIAPITAIASDPSDSFDEEEPTEVDAGYLWFSNFYWQFNTEVDVSSFCDDADGSGYCDPGTEQFTLTPPPDVAAIVNGPPDETTAPGWNVCSESGEYCGVDADCPDGATDLCEGSYVYTYNLLGFDDEIGIGYNTPLKTNTTYTFGLKPGAVLRDRCGAETTFATIDPAHEDLLSITFHTNEFDLNNLNILDGEVPRPTKKQQLVFNSQIDLSSLSSTEYTITPSPMNHTLGVYAFSSQEIIIGGHYALDTTYTFTLNAGATVEDAYGAVYTNTEAQSVTWKTQPSLTLVSSSPADNGEIGLLADGQAVGVTLTWNADMDESTLVPGTDFTFVNSTTGADVTTMVGFSVGVGSSSSGNTCDETSLGCQHRIRGPLPPGSYKFTLKQGAMISDYLGNVYTQPSDLIINFTVAAPVATPACL